jgi:osmotically inducible lipoprotein OsmB
MIKFFAAITLAAAGPVVGLSACGHTMQERAATGAAAGLIVGGPVGAAVGATAGAVVDKVDDARKEDK